MMSLAVVSKSTKGSLAALLAVASVSTFTVFGKMLLEHFQPHTMVALGPALSVLMILFFYGALPEFRKITRLSPRSMLLICVVSILSAVIGPLFYFQGLQFTSATNAILIGPLEFVWAGIISMIWLKEKVTLKQMLGAVIIIFGVLMIVTKGMSIMMDPNIGDMLVLCATFSWALSINVFKKYLHHINPELIVLVRNIIGALVLFIFIPLLLDVSHDLDPLFAMNALLPLIGYAIFAIILAQLFWYKSLELISASRASTIALSAPFFGILLSTTVLKEHLYTYHIIGGVLVVIGLVFTIMHGQKHPDHEIHQKVKHMKS